MRWDAIHRETTAVDDAEGRLHYAQNTSFKTAEEAQRRNGMSSTDVPKQAGPVLNMAQTFSDYQGLVQSIGATLIGTKNPAANTNDAKNYETGGGSSILVFGAPPKGVSQAVGKVYYKYIKLSFDFVCDKETMWAYDNYYSVFGVYLGYTYVRGGATGTFTLGINDSCMVYPSAHHFHAMLNGITANITTINATTYHAEGTFRLTGPENGIVANVSIADTFSPTTRDGITIGTLTPNLSDPNSYGSGGPGSNKKPWKGTFAYSNVTLEGE